MTNTKQANELRKLKEADIPECGRCENLLKEDGAITKDIYEDHKKCHGWTHCGPECCGACTICNN